MEQKITLSVLKLVAGLSSGTESCSYTYYKDFIITFLKTRFALWKAENVIENSD